MRWTPGGVSGDVEDRRGSGGGFGGNGVRLGLGGTIVLGILGFVFGQDFIGMVTGGGEGSVGGGGGPVARTNPAQDAREQEATQFVSFVLDDAQNTWSKLLPQYERAKLVLFRQGVRSGCGVAGAETGPFYCPVDEKVYLDLSFFDDLNRRFGAPGDFAQAYVIAHEIGHHVQHQLGIDRRVRQLQQSNPRAANALSVRQELQADCFAGVWGHSTAQRKILENGDVEEGLNAAAAIGDDRLQRRSGGGANPESFTHGSSAQRVAWFRRGLESGDVKACDTFNSRQ